MADPQPTDDLDFGLSIFDEAPTHDDEIPDPRTAWLIFGGAAVALLVLAMVAIL